MGGVRVLPQRSRAHRQAEVAPVMPTTHRGVHARCASLPDKPSTCVGTDDGWRASRRQPRRRPTSRPRLDGRDPLGRCPSVPHVHRHGWASSSATDDPEALTATSSQATLSLPAALAAQLQHGRPSAVVQVRRIQSSSSQRDDRRGAGAASTLFEKPTTTTDTVAMIVRRPQGSR